MLLGKLDVSGGGAVANDFHGSGAREEGASPGCKQYWRTPLPVILLAHHVHLSTPPPARRKTGDSTWAAVWIAVGATVLLSLLCLAREGGFFWHCDSQLWFVPMFEEASRAWHEGDWPILSRDVWVAGSIAGEYQVGTFSLAHNLLMVATWSLPLGQAGKIAVFSTLHLAILAAGTVLLARRRGLSVPLAVAVALGAAWNGWMIEWAATQWIATLMGFAWVPWAWWALEGACAPQASRRRRWLAPALFLYLVLAAGHAFSVVMLGLITLMLLARAGRRSFGPLAAAWGLGLLLSAPAWLMLVEYQRNSARADWGWAWQLSWVVPWRAWLAIGLPTLMTEWRGFWDQVIPHYGIEFAGALLPAAVLLAMLVRHGRNAWARWKWELALLGVTVLLASVPLIGSFRWSFRFLPLFHLVLALLGAEMWAELKVREVLRWAFGLVGISGLIGLFAHANFVPAMLWWELGFLLLAWALATWRWMPALTTAALLYVTYGLVQLPQSGFRHSFTENLLEPGPLDRERLYLSLYSFPDLVDGEHAPAGWGALIHPGNTAQLADLNFVNGYSSFNARGIPALFEPFGTLPHSTSEMLLGPEGAGLLEVLGVDGLVIAPREFDLISKLGPEWIQVADSPEAKVFHLEPRRAAPAHPLAWLQTKPDQNLVQPRLTSLFKSRERLVLKVDPAGETRQSRETVEDIGVLAEKPDSVPPSPLPSAIALSRPWLPGYHARLNGRELPVENYAGLVPMVELPPGAQGKLEFRYWPDSLRDGVWLAGTGWAIAAALLFPPPRRRRARKEALANELNE